MANINYVVADNWGAGFVANMTVPGGTAGLDGWTLEFDAAFEITNIWNAEILSHVGDHYVVRAAAWNGNVPSGGAISFGFQATPAPGAGGTVATGFVLNGEGSGTPEQPGGNPGEEPGEEPGENPGENPGGGEPGRIFHVSTTAADIVGFDPAKDKLDFGDVSVHNFIVVDTPQGVGFMNPWSGETCIIQGVSLSQLTIDSFTPIQNDHLRQDLSGALAWERGVTPAPNTVYARSHEVGQIDRVAFDPATDVVDFRYFGTREQVYMEDSPDGVVISNSGTGQALILLGITTGQLSADNFVFHFAQALEDRIPQQLGLGSVPDSQVLPQGVPVAGTNDWPSGDGGGTPPSGEVGITTTIQWHYGSDTVIAFDPARDKLDFGWFKDHEFSVDEVNGSTVISIAGNNQTYTLAGVSLWELEINNIIALDTGARAEWQGLINNATPPAALPVLSLDDGVVTEGDDGISQMTFTVTLSAPSDSPVSVSYSTLNGTATAGQDYHSAVGTITFAPGETTKTIQVGVVGDTLVEQDERFSLHLSSPTGATIMDGSAVGTILNDDVDEAPQTPPAISIADLSVEEGNGDHMHFMFMVTLDKASTEPVSVRYATSNGTAIAGSDYVATTGTVTFAPGETSKMIHVDILGDTIVEPDETFTVTLSQPTGATIADGTAIGTIVNDDVATPQLPALSIGDARIAEGNAGSSVLMFTVTLSQAAAGPVTVSYGTANGTATAGSDYAALSGTLTFAPGETSKMIHVAIAGDTVVEADETFTVSLSNASGATIMDGSATGTILNDDVAVPPAGRAFVDYSVRDNWGAGFVADMKVEAGASALNGWTVEFDASFTITNIWNAEIVSHVGNHYVVRNAAWNGGVGANQGVSFGFQATPGGSGTSATGFTINGVPSGGEPEPILPTLSVGDATVAEGDAGTSVLSFQVTLSGPSATPVTVGYATANGTAQAGSDYAALAGTLTFAPGETTKTVHVTVNGDTVVEGNETLGLNLSAPSGAIIARGSATGTITNDDVAAPLPTLSVGDISFAEGSEGAPGHGMFMVTLSAASATAVTVNFTTADGTAHAGSDYVAASGTLTFAPGETSKMVHVSAIGDGVVEPNESFSLVLSAPTGATVHRGTATGTITNDDTAGPQPTRPTLNVSDTTVVEGNPAGGAAASGWFSTEGNQIVDADGNTVQIAGVNWFGFESSNAAPHGLWTRGYKEMMDQMKDLGFNTIRLPFASDMLRAATANGIDYSKNPDLQGLTPLQIMDKIVDYAGDIGLRIILDHHRSTFGAGTSENGLWFDGSHSEAQWVSDWQMLAQRYANDPTIIGADLHNEPYNGTWGGGGANDWAAAAERAGNAIGEVNANWLVFVEGVGTYGGDSYWWGGNLMGVRDRPIDLNLDNKLVYSAHDYGNSVYAQSWFQSPDFAQHLPQVFDEAWGYIYREGIAPVYIGEFGTKLQDPKDAPWLEALTSYISGDFNNDGISDIAATDQGISWTYWSWNPNSGDTGGILKDDWRSVHTDKLAYLEPISFDFGADVPGGEGGGPGDQNHAAFIVTLSEPSTEVVTVNYHTVAGEAGAGDFTPVSGSLTFAPGETSKTILVPITADALDEPNETFSLLLTDAQGAVIGVGHAIGTILDDDAPSTPTDPGPGGNPGDPAPSGDLDAILTLVDSWGGGFNASIVLHNDGAATNGWQIEIQSPYEITNIWNAEIVSRDADGYVIRNAAWNGALGTDAEVSFGFIGAGNFNPSQVDILV